MSTNLFEIRYISSLSGYPGNSFSYDGKFEDEVYLKMKLYNKGKIPISKIDAVRQRPMTMIEYLTQNPDEIVDFMNYNHAINMANIFVMFRGELRLLHIQPYYFTKKQKRLFYSKIGKIKFYDYWNIHHTEISKMVTPETVLGYYHLYHVDDRVIRVYFKDKKNKFAYMLFPVSHLEYYGFKITTGLYEFKRNEQRIEIVDETHKLIEKLKRNGIVDDFSEYEELEKIANEFKYEPIKILKRKI